MTALRVVFALLIGLMSASGIAMAEESTEGAGTEASTETISDQPASPEDQTSETGGETGEGDTGTNEGDGSAPADEGDGSTPDGEGDGSTPADEGDGSTPDGEGDGSTPIEEGTGSESTESSDMGIFAIQPDGSMHAIEWVAFDVPAGALFRDLYSMSASLTDLSEDACAAGTGSPRFQIAVDTDGDSVSNGNIFVYLAKTPNFDSCDDPLNTGELVGGTELRWDTSQLGGTFYDSYQGALDKYGNKAVVDVSFVVDSGSLTPDSLVVTFKQPGNPSPLLGTVTVEKVFEGGTPTEQTCFVLKDATSTQVGAERCIPAANIEEGVGYTSFTRLPAGTYTVTETTTPAGFTSGGSGEVTIAAGYEGTVTLTSSFIPTESTVTINIASAFPVIDNTLPEGAEWSVRSDQFPGIELYDEFAPEHLQLPATIVVEDPLPVGTYTVTIDAGPDFKPYTGTFTLNDASETFTIQLLPAGDDLVNAIVSILIQILEDIVSEL